MQQCSFRIQHRKILFPSVTSVVGIASTRLDRFCVTVKRFLLLFFGLCFYERVSEIFSFDINNAHEKD